MKLHFIKNLIIVLTCIIGFSFAMPTYAEEIECDELPEAVQEANGCGNHSGNSNDLPIIIQNILDAIIAVSGTVAVIFVVVGGVQYMSSTGDAQKIEKAKKTILYACIGLAICALAFTIVNFTINRIIYDK